FFLSFLGFSRCAPVNPKDRIGEDADKPQEDARQKPGPAPPSRNPPNRERRLPRNARKRTRNPRLRARTVHMRSVRPRFPGQVQARDESPVRQNGEFPSSTTA